MCDAGNEENNKDPRERQKPGLGESLEVSGKAYHKNVSAKNNKSAKSVLQFSSLISFFFSTPAELQFFWYASGIQDSVEPATPRGPDQVNFISFASGIKWTAKMCLWKIGMAWDA
jgi:hypothetical protein